jgi:hypothetical protein
MRSTTRLRGLNVMLQHTRLILAGADHSVDGHLHPVDGSLDLTTPRWWAINTSMLRRQVRLYAYSYRYATRTGRERWRMRVM